MVAKTGSDSSVVLANSTTYGTAVQGTTGAKVRAKVNRAKNAESLVDDTIGSGDDMLSDSEAGAVSPTISLDKTARYDDAANIAEAVLFGGASVTDMGSGAYTHSFIYNATRNENFVTVAMDGYAAGVYEYPSCTPTKMTYNISNPPNYVRQTLEMLANEEVTESTTNTNASMDSATIADTKAIVVEPTDYFLINAQGGAALQTSDVKAFQEMTITVDVPASHVAEVKGSAGNSEPVLSGDPPLSVMINVTFKEQEDFTWVTAQEDGTEYKAEVRITGDLIGGGNYYGKSFFFPRLKIIEAPDYNLQNSGTNPLSVTFVALTATSAPTGMIDRLPYILTTNTEADAYIS